MTKIQDNLLKIKNFITKNKYLIFLLLFSFITHYQWFNVNAILTFGDWVYWPLTALNQLFNSFNTWNNFFNFGTCNTLNLLWTLFSYTTKNSSFVFSITVLIPIAIIGFLTPYYFIKKFTKNELISFICALFYGTITYFLIRQTAHLLIAFVYALTPLIIYFFIKALEKNKLVNWLIFVLFYGVSAYYEIRITYIITFILFFYFLFFQIYNIKKYWKNILISVIFFIGLNIFWLLPTIFGGMAANITTVVNRGLFGNSFFDLKNAFAISESTWTGSMPNYQFIKQPIIWYLWFIPIIAFSSFLFKKNNKHKKEIVFFGIISLLGVFLTKQVDFPLPNAYEWLYKNFPGFNLFREASKFYIITAIGYTGLIGYGLLNLKECKNKIWHKYIFSTLSIIIIIITILNVKPLITGEMKTMFIPRHIPQDYLVLKDFILKQPNYFRTMWVPADSRWGIYVNEKPKISNASIISADWQNFFNFPAFDPNWPIQKQIIDLYNKSFSNQLLDIASIKYVIVPIQDIANDDDFFIYYGGEKDPNIRQWYINQLDKVNWLKKINIGTKDLVVYENQNYRPHLYLTKQLETIYKDLSFTAIDWQFKNPTEYTIKLNNISQPIFLNFSEAYHPDWKLHLRNFNWFTVLLNKNYFIPDSNHFKNDATLNSFYLDPAQICSGNKCERNSDGSYNLELTLYFKPQSYFYLGLIISGTALFGCLGYLGWDFVRRRKGKKGDIEEGGEGKNI